MAGKRNEKMYYAYTLLSRKRGCFYIGMTSDIDRRMKEHRAGQCHTTARMSDFELIFYEAFKSKQDALRREKYFKTAKGKKMLRLILRESLQAVSEKI